MKPDAIQNSARLAITSALIRNSRANHLSWMVAVRCPTRLRQRFRHDAGRRHPGRGIAGHAAAQFGDRGGAHRRHPAEPAGEIAESRAEIEHEGRQRDPRHVRACRTTRRNCSITPPSVIGCGCIRSHVTIALVAPSSIVAAGEPGDGGRDILDRHRLKRRRRFVRRKIDRQAPPAPAAWRCRHRPTAR